MKQSRDQLQRYIWSVRCWLPPMHKDAALELYEDLLGQIEDREEERGFALEESEIAEMLKRCGHPLVVASRYLPEDAPADTRSAARLLWIWISPIATISLGLAALSLTVAIAGLLISAAFAAGFLAALKFAVRPSGLRPRTSQARLKEIL